MAQKIYGPYQFFQEGGKVEVYNLKRIKVYTLTNFNEVVQSLNNPKWRSEHYVRFFMKGKEYILIQHKEDNSQLIIERKYYLKEINR